MVAVAPFQTKADLRRAVIRTAARAHVRHDRTGMRAIAAGSQDNDGWASERERFSTIAFARQQASALPCAVTVQNPILPAGLTPCIPSPEATLTGGTDRCPSAPAGAAAQADARIPAACAAAPAFSSRSLHNGGNTDA
jgi:hypothetical protein